MGYRILIAAENTQGLAPQHFSGSCVAAGVAPVACPNCNSQLFPVFHLSFRDDRLARLNIWSRDYAHVLVCPSCALYMEPYFINHTPEIAVSGGLRDGGEILQAVQTPYACRALSLVPLADGPSNVPRHQIGGVGASTGTACPGCRREMHFFGIVDYDDLNVPLYENGGSPVSLIVGDMDHLLVEACARCGVLRLQWRLDRPPTRVVNPTRDTR